MKKSKYKKSEDSEYHKKKYESRGFKFEVGYEIPNTKWILVDDKLYHGGSGGVKVKVKCHCNEESLRSLSQLTHKSPPIQCGKCRRFYSKAQPEESWPGPKGIPADYFGRTKESARQRNLSFEITPTIAYNIYQSQSSTCALSGVPISFTSNNASLDRIDSSKGYTPTNIQWVHKDINRMKHAYPQEYFVTLCNAVSTAHPVPANNIFEKLGFKPTKP